jgi:hypothetical protein
LRKSFDDAAVNSSDAAPVAQTFGQTTLSPGSQLGETGALERQSAMLQVTSVSQLSDVKPTDWAFQALQSLVERYGCGLP